MFLAAATAAPGAACARELSIEATPCAKTIRIAAKDVPLEEIVGGLAKSMEVRLVAKTTLPEPVTFSGTGAPEELLKRLLHGKNLVVETKRKAECGAREVLSTVWLLPAGQDAPARGDGTPAPEAGVPAQPARQADADRPRGNRRGGAHPMTDEERREMRRKWREGQLSGGSEEDPATSPPAPAE